MPQPPCDNVALCLPGTQLPSPPGGAAREHSLFGHLPSVLLTPHLASGSAPANLSGVPVLRPPVVKGVEKMLEAGIGVLSPLSPSAKSVVESLIYLL